MNKDITFEELVIEMMPFSQELINWCKTHPEFLRALKNVYADRFISLGAIVTSQPNYNRSDEVIGVYTYDYKVKNPVFKQDFIVNKGKQDKEFILYTRNPKFGSSKYVKDINEFYKTYGSGEDYVNSHRLSFQDLPDEIKPRALDAIKLAQKMKGADLMKLSQEHIHKVYKEVQTLKQKRWRYKRKLKK